MISKILKLTWIPLLLAVAYSGWVIWDRNHTQVVRRPVYERPDPYGNELKIMEFYTRAETVKPGEKALLCYGVVNAASVRLTPPDADVWPSLTRCFEVSPAKTTHYILTAESADHHTISQSVDVNVK